MKNKATFVADLRDPKNPSTILVTPFRVVKTKASINTISALVESGADVGLEFE